MLELVKYAKRIVKEGKVERVGAPSKMGQQYKVNEGSIHMVRIFTKKGRTLMDCDCINHTDFCRESPMCVHKVASLIFESDNNFLKKADKLINMYEKWINLNLDISKEAMLDDLKNLRRLK